jgi:hypothetical protein
LPRRANLPEISEAGDPGRRRPEGLKPGIRRDFISCTEDAAASREYEVGKEAVAAGFALRLMIINMLIEKP